MIIKITHGNIKEKPIIFRKACSCNFRAISLVKEASELEAAAKLNKAR